jgi:dolichol-phosphate mannosyltransferase
MKLSIVSPIYKAENFIDKLVFEIQKSMIALNVDYEIILVDDRSKDNSWQKMKELSRKNANIKKEQFFYLMSKFDYLKI